MGGLFHGKRTRRARSSFCCRNRSVSSRSASRATRVSSLSCSSSAFSCSRSSTRSVSTPEPASWKGVCLKKERRAIAWRSIIDLSIQIVQESRLSMEADSQRHPIETWSISRRTVRARGAASPLGLLPQQTGSDPSRRGAVTPRRRWSPRKGSHVQCAYRDAVPDSTQSKNEAGRPTLRWATRVSPGLWAGRAHMVRLPLYQATKRGVWRVATLRIHKTRQMERGA